MNDARLGRMQAVADLRRAFDQAFEQSAEVRASQAENLLALRLGGDAYAVRARQTAGLLADQKIVPLPSPVSELLGIIGRRGEIVPVYDLRALLGYPGDATPPRWILLAGDGPLLGLAFDRFDGHLSVPRSALSAHQSSPAASAQVRETAAAPDGPRQIIDLSAVREAIGIASGR
jgi:purine-binding chemotaxis protein CheW